MIAPEGYVPFSEIFNTAEEESFGEAICYYEHELEKDCRVLNDFRPGDVLLSWLIQYVGPEFYLSNNVGKLVKIDPNIFLTRSWQCEDLVEDKPLDLKVKQIMSRREVARAHHEEVRERLAELEVRTEYFLAKQLRSNIILNVMSKKLLFGHLDHLQPFVFFTHTSFQLSLGLVKFDNETKLKNTFFIPTNIVEKYRETFEALEGYFLCVPRDRIDESWKDYWADIAARSIAVSKKNPRGEHHPEIYSPVDNAKSSVERETKLSRVCASLSNLGPDPKGRNTWKELVRFCSHDLNENVSMDTVKRALGRKK